MKASFIEGPNDTIGVSFEADNNDERLLLKLLSLQSEPDNLFQVHGWTIGGGPGTRAIKLYVVPKVERFEPHKNNSDLETLNHSAEHWERGHNQASKVNAYTAGYVAAMQATDTLVSIRLADASNGEECK